MIKQATKQGYAEMESGGVADLSYPTSTTRRGRVQDGGNICPTLTASSGVCKIDLEPINPMPDGTCRTIKSQYYKSSSNFGRSTTFGATGVKEGLAIRKLTPKECFRLMGFDDSDVDVLIENKISNTQLYKMAGNSIVVDMLECLFCQIFDDNNEIWV